MSTIHRRDLDLDGKSWSEVATLYLEDLTQRRNAPASLDHIALLLEQLVDIRDFCEQSNAKNIERNERIAALEQKIAQLVARPAIKFAGVYQDTGRYTPGDACTRQGGLWICKADTSGSFDHECWQLAVKKGDAR